MFSSKGNRLQTNQVVFVLSLLEDKLVVRCATEIVYNYQTPMISIGYNEDFWKDLRTELRNHSPRFGELRRLVFRGRHWTDPNWIFLKCIQHILQGN